MKNLNNLTCKTEEIPFLTSRCYSEKKEVPRKMGGVILVMGSGSPYKDFDLFTARFPGVKYDIMAVNSATEVMDLKFNHFVTSHPDVFLETANSGIAEHTHTITHPTIHYDYNWYYSPGQVTSGCLGAWISQSLGYDRVVLVGVPMNMPTCDTYLPALRDRVHMFPHVRSMSGNTKFLFGEVTEAWLWR